MSCCVLDCSAALAWVLPGEGGVTTDALLSEVAVQGATVPGLWPLEVANVLLGAERKGRITLAERDHALILLADLPIHVEPQTMARAWTDTVRLAQTRNLTAYDASYLEVAIRLGLPLASRDKELCQAALACGVKVLG